MPMSRTESIPIQRQWPQKLLEKEERRVCSLYWSVVRFDAFGIAELFYCTVGEKRLVCRWMALLWRGKWVPNAQSPLRLFLLFVIFATAFCHCSNFVMYCFSRGKQGSISLVVEHSTCNRKVRSSTLRLSWWLGCNTGPGFFANLFFRSELYDTVVATTTRSISTS